MTASKSIVTESLALAARFAETLAQFARREQELLRSLHARRIAIGRKFPLPAAEETRGSEGQLQKANGRFQAEEERLQAVYDARRARVERLRTQAARRAPAEARGAREDWLGTLQIRLRAAEARRDEEKTAEAARNAAFQAELSAERDHLLASTRRARAIVSGYRRFVRLLGAGSAPEGAAAESDGRLQRLRSSLEAVDLGIDELGKIATLRLFRYLPLPVAVILSLLAGGALYIFAHGTAGGIGPGLALSAALIAVSVSWHWMGGRAAAAPAAALSQALRQAARAYEDCRRSAAEEHVQRLHQIRDNFAEVHAKIAAQWERADQVQEEFASSQRAELTAQTGRLLATIVRRSRTLMERLSNERKERLAALERESESARTEAARAREAEAARLAHEGEVEWRDLESAWTAAVPPLIRHMEEKRTEFLRLFPAWSAAQIHNWTPPREFTPLVKFGEIRLDAARMETPRAPRLSLAALLAPASYSLPLALSFPEEGALLFETKGACPPPVGAALNNLVLRLLAATPPGKITFTVIDPIGLGQNFAALMHLADYEESLINRRIWTQQSQIEERLAELNEHIEKVIQMYLRNEYATITEYNAQAGTVAEKYHFLVIADFPAQFSEVALRRLRSIAASGPRCGVFTLIHHDLRAESQLKDELRAHALTVVGAGDRLSLPELPAIDGIALALDEPPSAELAAQLIHSVGKSSVDSNRVEVPFSQISPAAGDLWKLETTNELRVAIGRTGATKLQYLSLGKGTRQHALFAGKTGSGKSTLFHVIITNLALWCSPEQVEFYLIDFKKGVEFKCYAEKRLPHARVVAIESDREFALSVLLRVDEELKRRGDLFRKVGVQDLPGYKRAGGTEGIPRTLLIFDEFQEFFVEDDAVAQNASLLFDRLVRQGRAFGIHVLLGSQTLGGAYTLARATLGQMAIRVALQCNEADAYLIMDENNSAPRLLSRPGEAIYNDAAGAAEANSPFQVVWLPDEERDRRLEAITARARQEEKQRPLPIVFEGNAPADPRENELLRRLLSSPQALPASEARCWLGAPNSIKGPTEARFARQSGHNLLIVGQREDAAGAMLILSLLALLAQYPEGTAGFVFLHVFPAGTNEAKILENLADARPGDVALAAPPEAPAAISGVAATLKSRLAGKEVSGAARPVFVFIHGLQRFKKLRPEEEFSFSATKEDGALNSGEQFGGIMTEGSAHGVHLLASLDTFNSVSRFISRKALTEWEMRVVFQMSANDSASLLDSTAAANLGLHRAIYYNERDGALETFRPYAMADWEWVAPSIRQIARQRGGPPVESIPHSAP